MQESDRAELHQSVKELMQQTQNLLIAVSHMEPTTETEQLHDKLLQATEALLAAYDITAEAE